MSVLPGAKFLSEVFTLAGIEGRKVESCARQAGSKNMHTFD